MAARLERFLNSSSFFFLCLICLCLILLTPADAIYQCWETKRLTNIFFIAGAYVITFILAILIYATRIYTNQTALAGIPKAWIPIEKEDVNKSVRRLVMQGLARSAVISYQARPRDTSDEADSFSNYTDLLVDRDHPPWGFVEHPGWSSPTSPDLPNLPYRTVIQELPNLIEAKAVSIAPADDSLSNAADPFPDTRVVEALQRPASMGLRQYIRHLTDLGVIKSSELAADFLALYERARFSSHQLHEAEFRELMHLFAEILRGITSLAPPILEVIRDSASYRRADTESVIGPSDEEGETDTVDHFGYEGTFTPMRSNSLRPSNASTWETQSGYDTAPAVQSPASGLSVGSGSYTGPRSVRTPSIRSFRRVQSGQSGSSGGSVIRLAPTHSPADLPYTIHYAGHGS
ncbi:uncharacterized protein N7496_009065 [Penicillium cataractarum]|uniref:Defect at low temperature protein 1 n=1 Tax=Penicillium cataractarum TaxID=2100454 RepID=A0A9W9RZU2_9EURO|nr:uncharacterized protein N7496_009065 [Penicillium cataractarum]KAJ5369305.1 hypothetical protein N7496_009065 [Penicillium cataractarum]